MAIPGISMDIQDFGSVKLAAQNTTCTHRWFRQSLVKGTYTGEEYIHRMVSSVNYHGLNKETRDV